MIDLGQTLNEYPKSASRLTTWCTERLKEIQQEQLKHIPGDVATTVPEITPEIAESWTQAIMANNPRILYDFFDLHQIHIWPVFIMGEDYWGFEIRTENLITDENEPYNARLQAEMGGFLRGFKLLETQLS